MSSDRPDAAAAPAGESPRTRTSRRRLGGFLLGMGVLHVVVPKPFEAIIPRRLGHQRALNLLAAAAEAGSGALLLAPSPGARRLGGALATATIVGVYPANIEMALRAGAPTTPYAAATWLRLPLQFPLVAWAWKHARGPEGRHAA
jgi:uncharacterized membrane protein